MKCNVRYALDETLSLINRGDVVLVKSYGRLLSLVVTEVNPGFYKLIALDDARSFSCFSDTHFAKGSTIRELIDRITLSGEVRVEEYIPSNRISMEIKITKL